MTRDDLTHKRPRYNVRMPRDDIYVSYLHVLWIPTQQKYVVFWSRASSTFLILGTL